MKSRESYFIGGVNVDCKVDKYNERDVTVVVNM